MCLLWAAAVPLPQNNFLISLCDLAKSIYHHYFLELLPLCDSITNYTNNKETVEYMTCYFFRPSPGGFMGLINQVAPKNPVKRAQSLAAPGSTQGKKQALLHWCKRMTDGKEVRKSSGHTVRYPGIST